MSNFHSLEVVGRGSETQLRVGENLNKLIYQDKVWSHQTGKAKYMFSSAPTPFVPYQVSFSGELFQVCLSLLW